MIFKNIYEMKEYYKITQMNIKFISRCFNNEKH